MLAQCLNSSRRKTPDLGEGDSLSSQACQKRGKKQRNALNELEKSIVQSADYTVEAKGRLFPCDS